MEVTGLTAAKGKSFYPSADWSRFVWGSRQEEREREEGGLAERTATPT